MTSYPYFRLREIWNNSDTTMVNPNTYIRVYAHTNTDNCSKKNRKLIINTDSVIIYYRVSQHTNAIAIGFGTCKQCKERRNIGGFSILTLLLSHKNTHFYYIIRQWSHFARKSQTRICV